MKGPIARGTMRTSAVFAGRLLVQAGTLIFLARWLGPHQFGLFAGAASLAALLGTLATFGMHTVLVRAAARDPEQAIDVWRYAVPSTLVFGMVLTAIYLVAAPLFLDRLRGEWLLLVALGSSELLLQPLCLLAVSDHLGRGSVAGSQVLALLPLACRLVGVLLLPSGAADHAFDLLAPVYFVASGIGVAASWGTLDRFGARLSGWRFPDRRHLSDAAGFALLGVTAVGPAELDKALSARFLPLSAAGLYAAGARIVGACTLPVIALTVAALPRLFRESAASAALSGQSARLQRWILAASAAYGLCLALLLAVVAPWLPDLFGPAYTGMDEVIRSLCWGIPALAVRMGGGLILMSLGTPWERAGVELSGLIVMAAVAVAQVPALNSAGLAWAVVASEWTMAMISMSLVYRGGRRTSTGASTAA